MLKLKDISVMYKDKVVLDNVTFTANKGEVIGLVAPNGTGKTTLFNVMANYLKPNTGKVVFDEKYTYGTERAEIFIRKYLTTLPDQSDLFEDLSGVDHLKLFSNMWKGSTKHIQSIIDELKMGDYVKRKVRTYSLGMRQRLCFAMMVAADTPVMVMDEVMNGLDVANVALISKKLIELKQNDKLIFVASHLLENLDLYADRVLFLKGGNIIYEQELTAKNDVYIKVYIEEQHYQQVKNDYELPDDHLYIAGEILCIPIKEMTFVEQAKWIERFKNIELIIAPLGTAEYYTMYYHGMD